jgi:flagellar biosynthesis protein FlhG
VEFPPPTHQAQEAGAEEQQGAGNRDAFMRLYTPHRMAYIRGEGKPSAETGCPFCALVDKPDDVGLIVARGRLVYVVLNLYPKLTLHDVFTGQTRLEDAILPAPGGFSVLLAGSGMIEYSRLTPTVRDQLHEVIQRVRPRFDRVLLDTGAGISDVVLYTISLADEVLIVATPEPTSLTDAYATIKVLASTQPRRLIRLLVNQVERPGEARAIRKQLQLVVDRFVNSGLDKPVMIELLGEIPLDAAVREAVAKRELLLEGAPGSPAGQAIVAAAAKHIAG